MLITLCVLAKDESAKIGNLIHAISTQSLLREPYEFEFVAVCNGCSDNTAQVANKELDDAFGNTKVEYRVYDYPEPGKARSWNIAVHQLVDPNTKIIIFLDADIQIADNDVLAELVTQLSTDENATAVSGWPVKDIMLKPRKSLIDWFSLKVSSQTPARHSVNGSLYAARLENLKHIWLPVPTPGEDGFLSAMIHTNGFSEAVQLERIKRAQRPTHFYESHSIVGYFRHEIRMTVGTTINGWICETLTKRDHPVSIGPIIHEWNENDPSWVNKIVSSKVDGRFWALPPRLLTWRLNNLRGIGAVHAIGRAPFSILATLLNIWPCIMANRALKNQESANIW